MADVDVSLAAREMVDLSKETAMNLGNHLVLIGDIIQKGKLPPGKDERGTAKKLRDKLELYKEYQLDVLKRKNEIEQRMHDDLDRLQKWRQAAGTEGASLLEELEIFIAKVRKLEKELAEEKIRVAEEKRKVQALMERQVVREQKWHIAVAEFIKTKQAFKRDVRMRVPFGSWVQCSFDEIRFRFKAEQEAQRLLHEHMVRLRKNRAQSRLDVIRREQLKRTVQKCWLALQEETIESRAYKHIEEIRRKNDDKVLILEGQIAQALGDEEAAARLVAEQVRRMEEARRLQREAEQREKVALREARLAQEEAEQAKSERDEAIKEKEEAERQRNIAEKAEKEARRLMEEASERAADANVMRAKAEEAQRVLEIMVKKKGKKIESLQRILAELGAESDSDAPPDERAPPFFTNEDGTRVPRPRTRKERMAMAYREAESARCELRLGMAAMVDKDVNYKMYIDKMKKQLHLINQEVQEVRWANKVLQADNHLASSALAAATAGAVRLTLSADGRDEPCYAAMNFHPNGVLAPSLASVPPFSPSRPKLCPVAGSPNSPRKLFKTASTPIFMPPLATDPVGEKAPPPEKVVLAPLRKLKRSPNSEWRVGWH